MAGVEVVVTGAGTALPLAGSPDELLPGRPTREPVDPATALTGRGHRYKDRATKLALIAARAAMAEAGLLRDGALTVPGEAVGVVVSSNFGNMDTIGEVARTIADRGYAAASPMALPGTASNVIASWLAIGYGLRGANLTLSNGDTSGLDAVHWGRFLIAAGRVASVVVVGVEPDTPQARELRGDRPPTLDGAAALVLESRAHATARGSRPLATVGPYARAATHDAAVKSVRAAEPATVGLWCLPGGPAVERGGLDAVAADLPGAVQHDLDAVHGAGAGALGVLQCVAGVVWLRAGHGGAVLATACAGSTGGPDTAAALLLIGVGGEG